MKILFVCSANRDRSPTAERLYERHPGLEVKSAGVSWYARTPLTPELVNWADVILTMEKWQQDTIVEEYAEQISGKIIDFLDVPDMYQYMHPLLKDMISQKVDAWLDKNRKISNDQEE